MTKKRAPFIAECHNMEEEDQTEFDTFREAVTTCDECCTILGLADDRYVLIRPGS